MTMEIVSWFCFAELANYLPYYMGTRDSSSTFGAFFSLIHL